jgi:hypothetical protein
MHQSGGGWAKEDVSGEESGKRESMWPVSRPPILAGWPSLGLHSPPTFFIHLILFPSCSYHWPKASKARQFPFILFQSSLYLFIFEIFYFMTCNDGKQKHVVEKE